MNPAATPTPRARLHRFLLWIGLGLTTAGYLTLSTCSPRLTALEQVRLLGTLRVAMTNSPTTFYVGADGETGYEYDLAKALAERLDARLEIVLAESPSGALRMVQQGRAHFAAAAVVVTPERRPSFRFTPPVHKVVPQLVYRLGAAPPRDLSQLQGRLAVPTNSANAEHLRALRASRYRELVWEESADLGTEDLLYQVANEELAYTVANSDLLSINQRYYPNLRAAFALSDALDIAWAFPPGDDGSLYDLAVAYLSGLTGEDLAIIRDRHFGHIEQVNTFGALTLALHVETRLPPFRATFEQASVEHGLDWRLVAAMGYQESQWDPKAVSPTGVRGLMQLTMGTAALMRVANREDPIQSIRGGTAYFRMLMEQLPPEIQQPDRTWMALASYNIGIGHLLDARQLAKRNGGNPDRWIDVRAVLPLLTKPRWYSQTRYGYARGYEAMTYVGNIRTYYDMLVWLTEGSAPEKAPALPSQQSEPPPEKNPLHIHSPLL